MTMQKKYLGHHLVLVTAIILCLRVVCNGAEKNIEAHNGGASTPQLIQDLNSSNKTVKAGAIEKLSERNEVAAASKIIEAIDDTDWTVKNHAIKALGKMKVKSAVPALVRKIQNQGENWATRLEAAKSLGTIGAPEAISPAMSYLREACAMSKKQTLNPPTRKSYGSDREFLGIQIVGRMIELGKANPDKISSLTEAMNKEKGMTDFKFYIAYTLGTLGKKEVSPVLLSYLSESENGLFREKAAAVLGDLGDALAIEPLKKALSDTYRPDSTGDVRKVYGYSVRLAAYRALIKLGVRVEKKGDEYTILK